MLVLRGVYIRYKYMFKGPFSIASHVSIYQGCMKPQPLYVTENNEKITKLKMGILLLMEEILHRLTSMKPCKYWDI